VTLSLISLILNLALFDMVSPLDAEISTLGFGIDATSL